MSTVLEAMGAWRARATLFAATGVAMVVIAIIQRTH